MTDNLHALHRDRDRLYRKFKRNKSQENLEIYRQAWNISTQNTTQAKVNYYNSRLVHSHESKTTWSELWKLGLVKSKKSTNPAFGLDELNMHYASVSNISGNPINHPNSNSNLPKNTKFSFCPIQESDLKWTIHQYTSQAKGNDDIPIFQLLKWAI